jgi:hypothetical protein
MAHKTISREDPIVQVFFPYGIGTRLWGTLQPPAQRITHFWNRRISVIHTSAFAGISEWDAFADHVQQCMRCSEV